MLLLVLTTTAALVLLPARTGAAATDRAADPQRVVFGSCLHPHLPTDAFSAIRRLQPDLFLWTGDAVYHHRRSGLAGLAAAYRDQVARPGELGAMLADAGVLRAAGPHALRNASREQAAGLAMDGAWDDHDYGHNDGGKEVADKAERLRMFLDFLGVAAESPRRSRRGAYHSFVWGRVRFVLLDTRTHRDRHLLPSAGSVTWLPLGAPLGAVSRLAMATLLTPWAANFSGDVLGEEQWAWLDGVLDPAQNTGVDATIVVSSVQVLTSNPLLESWGHFPRARARLFRLLARHRPRGLLFLSGDVHFAELIGLSPEHGGRGGSDSDIYSRAGRVLEVTSSGLSHTCASPWFGFSCQPILDAFAAHRIAPNASATAKNFGVLDFDWPAASSGSGGSAQHGGGVVRVTVRDEHGATLLAAPPIPLGREPPAWLSTLGAEGREVDGPGERAGRARHFSIFAAGRGARAPLLVGGGAAVLVALAAAALAARAVARRSRL